MSMMTKVLKHCMVCLEREGRGGGELMMMLYVSHRHVWTAILYPSCSSLVSMSLTLMVTSEDGCYGVKMVMMM